MRVAVIDVGSNSVRLLISEDGLTVTKKVKITKLASGVISGMLNDEAVERTVRAVSFFVSEARKLGIIEIHVFATAAVRMAKNAKIFTDRVLDECGIVVDVISGEKESILGCLGALNGKDGGVIDIGGASSEIAVMKNGKIVYSESIDMGAVTLTDRFGQDAKRVREYVKKRVLEYGIVHCNCFYGIGGTATTVASVLNKLVVYDPKITHGFKFNKEQLQNLVELLYSMTVDERKKLVGLQPERAEVIASGLSIMLEIMNYLRIDFITVSESDNLEGYLLSK